MSTERRMRALGVTLGLVVAALLLSDMLLDNDLSHLSRKLVMLIAGITYSWVFGRQVRIAYRYEGIPLIRQMAFRWVVALWFGATGLFIWWVLAITVWSGLYTPSRSAVIWLIFAETTIYFVTRWISVGRPQIAGPGETGSNL